MGLFGGSSKKKHKGGAKTKAKGKSSAKQAKKTRSKRDVSELLAGQTLVREPVDDGMAPLKAPQAAPPMASQPSQTQSVSQPGAFSEAGWGGSFDDLDEVAVAAPQPLPSDVPPLPRMDPRSFQTLPTVEDVGEAQSLSPSPTGPQGDRDLRFATLPELGVEIEEPVSSGVPQALQVSVSESSRVSLQTLPTMDESAPVPGDTGTLPQVPEIIEVPEEKREPEKEEAPAEVKEEEAPRRVEETPQQDTMSNAAPKEEPAGEVEAVVDETAKDMLTTVSVNEPQREEARPEPVHIKEKTLHPLQRQAPRVTKPAPEPAVVEPDPAPAEAKKPSGPSAIVIESDEDIEPLLDDTLLWTSDIDNLLSSDEDEDTDQVILDFGEANADFLEADEDENSHVDVYLGQYFQG